ncbi:MAG: hypothetical protein RR022_00305 [Angelakisella sp.]
MTFRKALSLRFFAVLTLLCLLIGCGAPQPVAERRQTLKKPIAELVDALAEDWQLPMPAALDAELTTTLLGLSDQEIAQCKGYFSMSPQRPDQLVAVEALPGCAETVATRLEQRRDFVAQAYGDAVSGGVVFRGNYLFLLLAGGENHTELVAQATEKIEDNFEK